LTDPDAFAQLRPAALALLGRAAPVSLPGDVPRGEKGELYDLIQQFKQKVALPEDYATNSRYDWKAFRKLTGTLREIKTPEEMTLIRKAVEISCQGQNEVIKALRPDMSELEI
jgi:Xaa-Pro aminopeptidase